MTYNRPIGRKECDVINSILHIRPGFLFCLAALEDEIWKESPFEANTDLVHRRLPPFSFYK